jgi:hypothetical protein
MQRLVLFGDEYFYKLNKWIKNVGDALYRLMAVRFGTTMKGKHEQKRKLKNKLLGN